MTKTIKSDQLKIWDFFQSGSKKSFLPAMPRYKFLRKEVRKYVDKNSKVLNIGIGLGFLEERLYEDGFEVYALDPSENAVKNLNKKNIKAKIGSIERNSFKNNFFDLIVISEVLEHIPKNSLDASVSKLSNMLKSGGFIVATVPYNENLEDNNTICPKCGNQFHRWGHHNSFNHEDFLALFQNEFKTIKIKTLSFPDWSISIKGIFKALIKYFLGRIGSQITSPRIYFVAQKF